MLDAIKVENQNNELHFATKKISIEKVTSMLELDGWSIQD